MVAEVEIFLNVVESFLSPQDLIMESLVPPELEIIPWNFKQTQAFLTIILFVALPVRRSLLTALFF